MKSNKLNQINEIKTFIEEEMNLGDMFKKTRRREYVDSRRIFFYILRNRFLLTYEEVGKISKRDHATIIHSVKTFDYIVKRDIVLNSIYQKTLERVELVTSVPKTTRKEEILSKIEKLNKELLSLVD